MRVVWRLIGGVGLLAAVIGGTWACLSANAATDGGASLALAAAGLALAGLSVVARGRDTRKRIVSAIRVRAGGLGLVVFFPALTLAVMAAAVESDGTATFGLVAVAAFLLWVQGVAAASALPARVATAWLGSAVAVGLLALTCAGLLRAVVGAFVPETATADRIAAPAFLALASAALGAWARGRPDRRSFPGVITRVALGRARPGDAQLLLDGPASVLRSRAGS